MEFNCVVAGHSPSPSCSMGGLIVCFKFSKDLEFIMSQFMEICAVRFPF